MRTRLALVLTLLLAPALAAQSDDLAALQSRADGGDPAAQVALAERYAQGSGVVQNFAEAAAWFARAAETGSAQAQNQLGRLYHTGLGVAADRDTALRWLREAAEQGAPEHLYDLARVLEETPDTWPEAATLYQRAADAGHVDAAVSLGVMYQNGNGVAQDFARARALYDAPAAAGHARAQNNLGLLYVRGSGVPQDYDRAAALFAAAAEQGLAQAQTNLGVMYENGFGVDQSDAEAARLYKLGGAGAPAAEDGFVYDPRLTPPPADPAAIDTLRAAARAGDPLAQFQYGWMLVHLDTPGPGDWQDAALLFAAAAEKGLPAAMANLALLYQQGRGVPQDYVLAQMWLTLAVSGGLDTAGPRVTTLQQRMTPAQINEAQTLAQSQAQGHAQTGLQP